MWLSGVTDHWDKWSLSFSAHEVGTHDHLLVTDYRLHCARFVCWSLLRSNSDSSLRPGDTETMPYDTVKRHTTGSGVEYWKEHSMITIIIGVLCSQLSGSGQGATVIGWTRCHYKSKWQIQGCYGAYVLRSQCGRWWWLSQPTLNVCLRHDWPCIVVLINAWQDYSLIFVPNQDLSLKGRIRGDAPLGPSAPPSLPMSTT